MGCFPHTKGRFSMVKAGMTDGEIAKVEGVSRSTINSWRRTHMPETFEIEKEKTMYDHAMRKRLYDLGMTDNEIADRVGLTTDGISTWRRKHGLISNGKPGIRRGNYHPFSVQIKGKTKMLILRGIK